MFEAEEDGALTECELACILRTALGVAHLRVTRLFSAIDVHDTGKLTFGKKPLPLRPFQSHNAVHLDGETPLLPCSC